MVHTITLRYNKQKVEQFCSDILTEAVIDCQYWAGHDLPKHATRDSDGSVTAINFQHLLGDESLGRFKRSYLDIETLWQGLKEYVAVYQDQLDVLPGKAIIVLSSYMLDDFEIDELIRFVLLDNCTFTTD